MAGDVTPISISPDFRTALFGRADPEDLAACDSGSRSGKPNNQAFTAELSYHPFGKTVSTLSSLANLRLAVQYVHYFQFNGGIRNYDGSGRNAVGNDTLFLSGQLAF